MLEAVDDLGQEQDRLSPLLLLPSAPLTAGS